MSEVREALESENDEKIIETTDALEELLQEIGQAVYTAQAAQNAPGETAEADTSPDKDDTIEGEFREV